jgi:peptidoglycan/LPS O-acetylase OafA/YrhL
MFRTDIQVLRGAAVMVVLFYHAKLPLFSAGYLGVDSFFVISGFLITSLITQELELGQFSLKQFYARRAKRLIPAAYVTFVATTVASCYLLSNSERYDYFLQTIGAVTFTANVFLWKQTGYFEGAGDLKPLLHTWSLAIEEQYYLVAPALLKLVPQKFWARLMISACLVSLSLAVLYSQRMSEAFYLLPFRAWELLLGSIGALAFRRSWIRNIPDYVFGCALILLVALPMVGLRVRGFDVGGLLVCVATLIVLLKNSPRLYSGTIPLALARIGDFSYSLYLVHWPLFAFFYNAWISGSDALSLTIRWLLIGASLILALLLHTFVEKPFHHRQNIAMGKIFAATLLASFFVMGFAAMPLLIIKSDSVLGPARKINYGFDASCDFASRFVSTKACRSSTSPKVMVWGDSYAMHLVPGLLEGDNGEKNEVIQATKSVCAPLIGLAFVEPKGYDRIWAEDCIAFNDSVIAYLSVSTSSIETVVISSPFARFLGEGNVLERASPNTSAVIVSQGEEVAFRGLLRTLRALRSIGKKVVLVAPPPAANFDIGRCHERIRLNQPVLLENESCDILDSDRRAHQSGVLRFLERVRLSDQVQVINFADVLCDSIRCVTSIANVPLYNDRGHLSPAGSKLLADKLKLNQMITELAN